MLWEYFKYLFSSTTEGFEAPEVPSASYQLTDKLQFPGDKNKIRVLANVLNHQNVVEGRKKKWNNWRRKTFQTSQSHNFPDTKLWFRSPDCV